jgi:hypothetical protein
MRLKSCIPRENVKNKSTRGRSLPFRKELFPTLNFEANTYKELGGIHSLG